MVLCSLHRLTPLAQRFYVSNTKKEFLCVVLILGMFTIALSSFPGLPIFLRRQFYWTSLVRLSESIVAGGSLTTRIVPNIKPSIALLKDGVSNPTF
jgi:hypothetical protein